MKKILYLAIAVPFVFLSSCKKDNSSTEPVFVGEGSRENPVPLTFGNVHKGKVKSNSISYYSFTPEKTGTYEIVFSNVSNSADIAIMLEKTSFQCEWCDNMANYAHTYIEDGKYGCRTNNLTMDSTYLILVSNELVLFYEGGHSDTVNATFDLEIKKMGISEGSMYDPVKVIINETKNASFDACPNLNSASYSYYYFTAVSNSHIVNINHNYDVFQIQENYYDMQAPSSDSNLPFYYLDNCFGDTVTPCQKYTGSYSVELKNLQIGNDYCIEIQSTYFDIINDLSILIN